MSATRVATRSGEAEGGGDRFFLMMAGLLLVITAVGFTPTFYLGALFDGPSLPPVVVAHGVLSSAWILVFVGQVSLINGSRTRLHRRVGPVGGIVAGAMLISGLLLLHSVIQRAEDLTAELPRIGPLVWGNLAILAAFAAFVVLGLWFRRRPDAHKRLMLLATVSMMGQPMVRIGQIEAIRISDVRGTNDAIYGLGGLAVLLLLIVAYELRSRGRPHPAVAIGAPALLGAIVFTGLIIPGSEMGRAFILWWSGL